MEKKKFSTQEIVEVLKKEGKYTSELLIQATLLGKLLAKLEQLEVAMNDKEYSPIIMKKAYTGQENADINPLESLYLQYYDRVQRAIKALGMNVDSKERKTDHDSFYDFMNEFRNDAD